MVIRGNIIELRDYTKERCHEFYKKYVSDPSMTYDQYEYDEDKVNQFYKDKVEDTKRRFFAVCYENRIVGEIQIKRIDFQKSCGTMSIHLANDSVKGRGIGTEAEQLILQYGIKELGLKTIYADAIHRNRRSIYILEKLGFQHMYDDEILSYYKYEE